MRDPNLSDREIIMLADMMAMQGLDSDMIEHVLATATDAVSAALNAGAGLIPERIAEEKNRDCAFVAMVMALCNKFARHAQQASAMLEPAGHA